MQEPADEIVCVGNHSIKLSIDREDILKLSFGESFRLMDDDTALELACVLAGRVHLNKTSLSQLHEAHKVLFELESMLGELRARIR